MNLEKHTKKVLQQSLNEEDHVPVHPRRTLIMRKYIKIPKIFFLGRRHKASLLKDLEQEVFSFGQKGVNHSPQN
jgi:hypothetical protein